MSAYAEECKQRCEWCAKGKSRQEVGMRTEVFLMHPIPHCTSCNCVGMLHCSDPEHCGQVTEFVACTAPTPVQFMEEQAKQIAELKAARDNRQSLVAQWCADAFGADHAASIPTRGIRLAEESIEAAQAAGCDAAMVHNLVDYVYSLPSGNLAQELGGVGITLLALAQAAGVSADAEEDREYRRVTSKPLDHFKARNEAKNAAGFNATPDYCVTDDTARWLDAENAKCPHDRTNEDGQCRSCGKDCRA